MAIRRVPSTPPGCLPRLPSLSVEAVWLCRENPIPKCPCQAPPRQNEIARIADPAEQRCGDAGGAVSRGRKKAKQIDEAVINRARLLADYYLTLHPVTDDEAVKEDRRRKLRNAEDYLEDVGTPIFELNMQRAAYFALTGARQWVELCLAFAAHFVERGEPVPEPIRRLLPAHSASFASRNIQPASSIKK